MENVTSSTRKLCDLFAAAEVSKANNALIWAIRNVFLRFFELVKLVFNALLDLFLKDVAKDELERVLLVVPPHYIWQINAKSNLIRKGLTPESGEHAHNFFVDDEGLVVGSTKSEW